MSGPKLYLYTDNDKKKPDNFLEELQVALIKRFSKVPKKPEPVIYELTTDRALLHQYYRLREAMYRKTFETDAFYGNEDVYDKISYILIARRGKLCIGGCRLTIREADEQFPLPMESEGFKLREALPQLPLEQLGHCEVSRFAVFTDDEHSLELMYTLSKLAADKAIAAGLGYIFVKSTYPLARNWRAIAHKLGLNKTEICKDVHPAVEPALNPSVRRYVIMSDITAFSNADLKIKPRPAPEPVSIPPNPHLTPVD